MTTNKKKKALDLADYEKYINSDLHLLILKSQKLLEKYALKPLGLSFITLQILFIISHGEKVYQSTLSEYLPTTPANISNRLDSLEKKKLLTRVSASSHNAIRDRRKNYLRLTPAGETVLHQGVKEVTRVKNLFVADWQEDEINTLIKLLNKLGRNISRAEGKLQETEKGKKKQN